MTIGFCLAEFGARLLLVELDLALAAFTFHPYNPDLSFTHCLAFSCLDKAKILQMNILKKGKKQDISNRNLASQEGNKNIKMHEIENLVLCKFQL